MIYDRIKDTAKHTLIFGIASVVNSAIGFLLVPVYMRYLRATEYGVLSLLTITLTLLSIVLKVGLNHGFFRHYYETEDPDRRRVLVGSTLVFLACSSAIATGVLYAAAPQISALIFRGDSARAGLLRLVFAACFFEVITLIPQSILRAKFQSARYSALSILAFGFQIGLIAYLVLWVDSNVENVLIGRLAGTIFEAGLFYYVVRRELSLRFSGRDLRELLSFGAPLIFGQLGFTLFLMIDRFFLERYAGEKGVGVYGMACTIVSVVSVLVTAPFGQVWTVMRFSVMNDQEAEEYYSRVLTYIVLVSMFLSLGVAAVSGDGILLFGLKSYWPAATIIPLLALSMVLDSASRVLNVGTTLRKRTIYAPIVIAAALVFNIALNFALIPRFKIMGATISTLISYVVFCALRYWSSNLFFKVRYEWRRVFTIAALGSAATAGFYLIDRFRGDQPTTRALCLSVLVKISLVFLLPAALYITGFFDERELRRISLGVHQAVARVGREKMFRARTGEQSGGEASRPVHGG